MFKADTELQRTRAMLTSGEIAPRTLAEQALARANRNAGRNVYISRDPEWTLREAEELPHRFAGDSGSQSTDDSQPLLYGLPVSLKDCFDLAGFRTTCGSRFYAERNGVAREDSAVAARLRSKGAVIVGKTHMHPLAYGITGENPDYGDCVQPDDARWLTGGSSSGSAASLQEGSALAAIGTDTGGSIRVPAALCGLAGYRASIDLAHQSGPWRGDLWRGDLWRGGMHLAPTFDTLGWLFRDLRDGPLLADALFGLTVPAEAEMRVRIGCVGAAFLSDCEDAVLAALTDWKKKLSVLGAESTEFDAGFWDEAMAIYAPIQASEAAAIHKEATGGDFSHFEKSIAERLTWGASIGAGELETLRERLGIFRERMDGVLQENDFVIAPCAPVCRLSAGADHKESRRIILRYTTPVSLGGYPAVTLPGPDGAGIQLVAARSADRRLLAYAAAIA